MNNSLYLVAGLGKTGLSIARYLTRNNKSFIAFDTRKEAPGIDEFKKAFPNVELYLEHVPKEKLKQITDIITSPGLPLDTPFLKQAKHAAIPVYGDIECLAREIKAPVVAITGTNGKSTVTTLIGEMAKAAGMSVAVAGNIGMPVLDLLNDGHHYDLWVLELSSFQLELTYSLQPLVATILNISPDHIDRHHTLEAYIQAKQSIYKHAKVALFNRDDIYTIPNEEYKTINAKVSFGDNKPNAGNWGLITQSNAIYLARSEECLLPVEALLIKGVHNWLNALAACALAEHAGIAASYVLEVLKTFRGLPHRCQWIRTLEHVDWINDSKGTNVGATLSAIKGIGKSMQGKIVLIAGGQGKDADFKELTQSITDFTRSIILIGEDAPKMEAAFAHLVPTMRAPSLEKAVELAKTCAKPGDVVLLSPACASLDMFRDFNHRGEVFISSVMGL